MSSKRSRSFKHGPGQRCCVADCGKCARAYCFECEKLYCSSHLNRIRLRAIGRTQDFLVCSACLAIYASDPTLSPILKLGKPVAAPLVTHIHVTAQN